MKDLLNFFDKPKDPSVSKLFLLEWLLLIQLESGLLVKLKNQKL